MRTYAIYFNGKAPKSWTHEAITEDPYTFSSTEIADLASLVVGESARLFDGSRATLVEG